MIYLEMSRDETHGGGTWAFPKCVWAPTKRRDGSSWPFYSKILQINDGDVIIHLRGKKPEAWFVGCSIASGNGFETNSRPPHPGDSDFAERYFRANLTNFTPFDRPVNLLEVFEGKKSELEEYFDRNKVHGLNKANIFYVRQKGRLQCLNGAYLSDVEDELLTILFDYESTIAAPDGYVKIVSVETGTQIATVRSRLGQSKFAGKIKELYCNRCCFPGCSVTDRRFLVASHIARWADNDKLRGELGNGLCFCLLHDKAFESGIFTIDDQFRVFANPKEQNVESPFLRELISCHGQQIRLAKIQPLKDALLEHWDRIGIKP